MNKLNEQRAVSVADQLFGLKPEDATPTTDFSVEPEYTLIAHLPEDINHSIYAIASELQVRFPNHYYYSPGQYHLTVVPIPLSIEPERSIKLITPLVKGWHLPIEARGLAANRFQASVVLYPEEETLVPQRAKLRAALGIPEQAFTIHRPVWEELLWVNFMRFTTEPEHELLEFLRARAQLEIGHFVASRYELYTVSTKTLDPGSSKLLHTFEA